MHSQPQLGGKKRKRKKKKTQSPSFSWRFSWWTCLYPHGIPQLRKNSNKYRPHYPPFNSLWEEFSILLLLLLLLVVRTTSTHTILCKALGCSISFKMQTQKKKKNSQKYPPSTSPHWNARCCFSFSLKFPLATPCVQAPGIRCPWNFTLFDLSRSYLIILLLLILLIPSSLHSLVQHILCKLPVSHNPLDVKIKRAKKKKNRTLNVEETGMKNHSQ